MFLAIDQSWPELAKNPLFRRGLGSRALARPWSHPIVRPLAVAMIVVFLLWGPLDQLALRALGRWIGFLALFVAAFAVYFMAQGFQRLACHQRMCELRDQGTLSHLLSTGMPASDVIMGLVFPYILGDRLGIIAILIAVTFGAAPGAGQAVLIVLVVLSILQLFHRPTVIATTLEQFFQRRSIVSIWRIMVGAGVPMATWFALLAVSLLLFARWIPRAFGLAPYYLSPNAMFIAVFISAYFAHRWVMRFWWRREMVAFLRRHGSIEGLLEEFLEADGSGNV